VICGAEGVNKCKICCYTVYHDVNFATIACGAETLYLGAAVHSTEFRVYFLKSFQKRRKNHKKVAPRVRQAAGSGAIAIDIFAPQMMMNIDPFSF
jgi:23S rRNA maturation mini-RNase III